MDISEQHPAFSGGGRITSSLIYRLSQIAERKGWRVTDTVNMPREDRLWELAMDDVRWRIEALESYDRKKDQK